MSKIRIKYLLFLFKLIFSFGVLLSCQTLPIRDDFQSLTLYMSSAFHFKTHKKKWDAYVYVTGKDTRIDIKRPFVGYVAHIYLNKRHMIIHLPYEKVYYKGKFKSQLFLPQFFDLPYEWIHDLLIDKIPKEWKCTKTALPVCSAEIQKNLQVRWIERSGLVQKIELKTSERSKWIMKLERLSYKKLENPLFHFKVKKNKRIQREKLQKYF